MRRWMGSLWIAPLALALVSVAPATAGAATTTPTLFGMEIHPPALIGGASTTLEPDLTAAAPAGGVVVSLSSSDPAVAPVPATVTIPAGSFLTNVTITTTKVTALTTVEITATLPSGSVSAPLQVDPPDTVRSLSLTPTTVTAGSESVGHVTLGAPAPFANVLTVSLASSDPAVASVPGSVEVLNGGTAVNFTITTSDVPADTAVTITASIGTSEASAVLTVGPAPPPTAAIQSVTLASGTVDGGQSTAGTVTLTLPAPAGGATVSLATSDTRAARVPASVVVPGGATTATFAVTTLSQSATTTVSVGGVYDGTSRAALLGVIGKKGGAPLSGPPPGIFIEPFTLGPTPEGAGLTVDHPLEVGVTPFQTVSGALESGSLPRGLQLGVGLTRLTFTINGIPTTPGLYAFVLQFTLLTGTTFGWPYVWQITAPTPLEITEASVPKDGTVGKAYTGGFFFGGGVSPYKWSIAAGKLPPGLSINATTSQISGTPTKAGTYSFTARLTDALGTFVTSAQTITIAPG